MSIMVITLVMAMLLAVYALANPDFDIHLITNIIIALLIINIGTLFILLRKYKSIVPSDETLRLSIIGLPSVGKTVFCTVFMYSLIVKELINIDKEKISMEKYGDDTSERVTKDYADLLKGINPPSTSLRRYMSYRGVLNIGSSARCGPNKYSFVVSDHAGQPLEEMVREMSGAKPEKDNDFSDSHFRKTEYFKDIKESQMFFLMVDLEKLLNEEVESINTVDLERAFLTTIMDVRRKRKQNLDDKFPYPIALIFLKSDALKGDPEYIKDDVIGKFSNLCSYCKKECEHFACYFISSTSGNVEELKQKIKPSENFFEPFEWALQRYRENAEN